MITQFYSGILTLFFIFLSARVIIFRRKNKIALGDCQNDNLKQLIRSHANFIEYTPLFLIQLYLLENTKHFNISKLIINAIAIVFLLGRIIHAYGITQAEKYENGSLKSSTKFRVIGMIATFSTLSITSLTLILEALY